MVRDERSEKGDPTSGTSDDVGRRSYLKLLGVGATVGTGVSALAGQAGAATTRHGISFDTTYHAVDDLGMDPNGNDPVDAQVEQAFADNALVEVPAGEYLVGGTVQASGRAGFVGTGSSREDARFTVPSGSAGATFVFEGGEGLFENLSFDQGWNWDKLISLVMQGGSWQYRKVALLGTEPNAGVMGDGVTSFLQTSNAGGLSLYVDDLKKTGPADIRDYPDGRNVVITGHGTDVTVRNSDIRNSTVGSGLYLNNTSGEVLVENNYFENCAHTAVRVNGANATVRNNAVVVDPWGEYGNPDNRWNSTEFSDGQWPMRGIWVYDPEDRTSGDAVLENNHVYHGSGSLIGCVMVDESADGATMQGTCVKSDPGGTLVSASSPTDIGDAAVTGNGYVGGSGLISNSCVASDVSLSMETSNVTRSSCTQPDIVRGEPPGGDGSSGSGGSGDSTTDLPNTLTIQGTGTEANYEFSVSDQLQPNDDGAPLESWDELSGATANGWVTTTSQVDSFEFSGEITDFQFLEGSAAVYVNGDRVDPASLGPIPRTLRVKSTDGTAAYEFTVSGDLEGGADGDVESGDSLSGSSASGSVSGSDTVDTYQFSGDVTSFTFTEGSATVYVDGSKTTLGQDPLDNTVTIRGTGTEANYEFSVSGDMEANPDEGKLESWDELSGSTANGWVTEPSQVDSFVFSGEITDFQFLEGSAAVYVNGDRVDPATLEPIPRTLRVKSTDGTAAYEFTVSGDLEGGATGDVESGDSLSGSSASGSVSGSDTVDTYQFSGDVTSFTFTEGSATVYVDGSKTTLGQNPLDNTVTIQGEGVPANYEFSVSGDLKANSDEGELESWDELSGSTANGWVTEPSQVDSFVFSGEITDFQFLEGSAAVYVNGQEANYGDDTSDSDTHTLTIEGDGTATNYSFTVSGDLAENATDGNLEPWDSLSGASAEGWVTFPSQRDSFEFTGEVTDFEFLEGSATVYVDGSEVDPSTLGEPTTHTLTIEGDGTATNYAFTVSGDLAENATDGKLESWDSLSGASAEGWVTFPSQRDSFEFTGEVTDFEFLEGSATVYVDGSEVDPSSL